jgi:ABC-type transport system involved in multi-copper enzyme maturation permease subunit
MLQRFQALALNTFLETIRQPIYGVILLATAFLMILNVSLAGFTLDDDDKLLLDLGLSTLLLSGLFLSAFSAAGVLSREIDNKTVLTVISKPVSRPVFILGKFAGLVGALSVAFYLNFLVFVLVLRHGVMENTSDPWDLPVLVFGFGSLFAAFVAAAFCNYFYGAHFSTTVVAFVTPLLTISVGLLTKFDEHFKVVELGSKFVGGQIIIAGFLVYLAVILTASVAVAASTRVGQMLTLLICTLFVALGVVSDYAFGQHAGTSRVAAAIYHVVPNINPFWVVEGLQAGSTQTTVTPQYLAYVSLYAALLISASIALAVALFQKREVG